MATTATAEQIAEARAAVAHARHEADSIRTKLVEAARSDRLDEVDIHVGDLFGALGRVGLYEDILGDMEAGAGDFHDWGAEPDTTD